MAKTWKPPKAQSAATAETTAESLPERELTHLERVIYRAAEKLGNMRGLPEPYDLDDILYLKIDRVIKKVLRYADERELGTLKTVMQCALDLAYTDANFYLQLLTYRLMETFSLAYCHNVLVRSVEDNRVVEIPQWVLMDDSKKRWADEGRTKQLLHFVDSRLKDRGVLRGSTSGTR
jgi:hypothetical protein